jgi:hypothetical protein
MGTWGKRIRLALAGCQKGEGKPYPKNRLPEIYAAIKKEKLNVKILEDDEYMAANGYENHVIIYEG